MYFLDNASTTRVLSSSLEIMNRFNSQDFFNPSAKYGKAVDVAKNIDNARDVIKEILNVDDFKVIFTASATEANNLAIMGSIKAGQELVVSGGEHSSVYAVAKHLENQGRVVHFVPLKEDGTVDEKKLLDCVNANTGVVSLIHTSNETGAINDIAKLSKLCRSKNKKVLLHTDLVQAFCKIDVDLEELGVDMATISAHKIHGPKGIGALLKRENLSLKPIIFGGGQEEGIRSGTENVASIMAFANSAKTMYDEIDENFELISKFKKEFELKLSDAVRDLGLNIIFNHSKSESPYILSLAILGVRGEILLHALEKYEVFIGTGSACSSHAKENRVLKEAGKTHEEIDGNLRISFSHESLNYDIDEIVSRFVSALKDIKK